MIEIKFKQTSRTRSVEMTGHAMTGEAGEDIVCAAASMLAYTLAENVARAYNSGMLRSRPTLTLEDGHALIKCAARAKRRDGAQGGFQGTVAMMYTVIRAGFELLERQYPDSVRVS